ncbi:DAK2 domain-containing protein [Cellulomonas edaphi]|uniref:DAK2 domain-containing protein n=1 Tax=Cellulomonas edaphi TaxID=3053468 RepID=A0ABT7S847_9CELL|nr:DAK2 domain-containing protein [Cellulomons edaphi]MDM7831699.1 DAK2 domain-containing protein [Cellulomons edaphi]
MGQGVGRVAQGRGTAGSTRVDEGTQADVTTDRLDGGAVRAWARAARTGLERARERIDAVNVFPVADSDTGTNVLLTVVGGADAVELAPDDADAHQVAAAFARGAMVAARGNSGVILSQYLAGLARGLGAAPDAREASAALAGAARSARQALADPQEGTVLTVADEVAQGAIIAADAGADLPTMLAEVVDDAHRALATISAAHPVLRRAHVLDAGACALLVVLGALARVAAGAPDPVPDLDWLPAARALGGDAAEAGPAGGAYEVMALVRGGPRDLGAELRTSLGTVGDSVAVVGADGWWHVHVHTDDPAAAIALCEVGVREQVVVRQLESSHTVTAGAPGLVVCTASTALAPWFAAAGAVTVVRCPEAVVTAEHVTRAVTDTGAGRVVLLPGGGLEADQVSALARSHGDGLVVLDAADELRAAVAALAFVAADGTAEESATAALARLQVAVADDAASFEALVGGLEGPGENLTVLHREPLEDDARARIERAGPAFEVTFVGPTGHGPLLAAGLD